MDPFWKYPKGKMLSTLGERSFSMAVPKLWNTLPYHIRSEQRLASFKCKVKTFLFNKAFAK